jgi:hypothetical protein
LIFTTLAIFFLLLCLSRERFLINDKRWQATVYDFANCFKPDGMLASQVLEFGLFLLREKYKDSNKLIIPYWVCVSSNHFFFF